MKTQPIWRSIALALTRTAQCALWMFLFPGFTICTTSAATVAVYTNDFESYTTVATSLADESDANPAGQGPTSADGTLYVFDDVPLAGAGAPGSGVQVANWLGHSGSKSLLVRPGSEARVFLRKTRSGSGYQLDFRLYSDRETTSSHNFYILLNGMGTDNNGGDFLAYRGGRAVGDTALVCFDGVRSAPGWASVGTNHLTQEWQHHRIVFDPNVPSLSVYVDDMNTPLLVNSGTARSEVPMPTMMRIVNEGNSADDGFFAIDDIGLSVDDSIDLATTFTEGFESYTARTSESDDADPQGPWITTETDGTAAGGGRPLAPAKVQVVDSSVVTPRSGNKCLKLEAGQRAGVTLAWGVPPESDVQITWWARVPASVQGTTANYLRMSLYGTEGGNSFAGDKALLGYGSRDATIGDATSLTYFTTAWVDTTIDYTPDTWEEYQLTTHNSQGTYSIVKNPGGPSPQVVVDRAGYIGSALEWGPTFMAAWNSSNGTNHPPVYVDDIEINSLVSTPVPLPVPYNVVIEGDRFTNVTILEVGGPVGKAVVDPRDNETILFTMDAVWPGGGIYRARKAASGNWSVDPEPVVTGIDRPSGLTVAADGTLWWVHDFTMSLQRLKAPWNSNSPEEIISNFGSATTDDDPIDVAIAPASFTGSLGSPNMVVVADRGSDGDANNAIYLIDPNATVFYQATYTTFLVNPTPSILGAGNLNAITPLPQSGEVVTLSQDGWISAVNGDGVVRNIWPVTLWADIFGPAPSGAAIAADPITGKLWVAEDFLDELWSVDPATATQDSAPDQKEVSFSLTDTNQPNRQLDVHDPGLSFAPNGDFLVLSDSSTQNGGGRLIIFHNEPTGVPTFSIIAGNRVPEGFQLSWEATGSATYEVWRGTNLAAPASFVNISGDLSGTTFTDSNAPAGGAFYRVIAK